MAKLKVKSDFEKQSSQRCLSTFLLCDLLLFQWLEKIAMLPSLKRQKIMSVQECQAVLHKVESTLDSANKVLSEARIVAEPAGLYVDNTSFLAPDLTSCSNTDHVILRTGDDVTDRVEELKRRLLVRRKIQLPESRGEGRWDKPKKLGERRRRVMREADLPEAPPVPPPAAYVVFVSQVCLCRTDASSLNECLRSMLLTHSCSYIDDSQDPS